jgi:hypothetical protein
VQGLKARSIVGFEMVSPLLHSTGSGSIFVVQEQSLVTIKGSVPEVEDEARID